MIRVILTAAVAVAAAFYAGYQTARNGDPVATTAAAVVGDRTLTEPVSRRATLTPADVELLKRELVAAISQAPRGATPPVEQQAATPQSETDEATAANESLQYVLDRAVANGVWTSEDARALNSVMGRASPHAVHNALSTLAAAINDQQLRIETPGFPY